LAPVAAASILARSSPGFGGHGAGGGLSAATASTCTAGKGALAAALSSKVALGAAVIATATAGTAGVVALKSIIHSQRSGAPRVAATSVHRGLLHIDATARAGPARNGRSTTSATGLSRTGSGGSGHDSGGSGDASRTAGPAHYQDAHASVGRRGGQRHTTARSGAGVHGAKGRARSNGHGNHSQAARPLKGKHAGLGRARAQVRGPARAAPGAGLAPGHFRHR
jgi:hypothetical protein